MDFRPVNFKLWLAAGVLLAAGAAWAQSGQSIIFSKPADHSATPEATDTRIYPGANNPANASSVPSSLFNEPAMPNPLPPPQLSPDEQQRMQKDLQNRKDWTLMTPEEILGVATPESLLLPPDQRPENKDKNLTPLERFMNRQEAERHQAAGTNANGIANNLVRWDFLQKPQDSPDGSRVEALHANNTANVSPYWKQFFSTAPENNNPAMAQDNAGIWQRPFGQVTLPSAADNLARIAEMERFRAMLSPGAAPADKASPGSKFLYSSQPLPEANAQPAPALTPVFNAVTPVSVAAKPAELTTLKPLSGQPAAKPATAARPSWAPQPPPWLSQTPQPFSPPQREF